MDFTFYTLRIYQGFLLYKVFDNEASYELIKLTLYESRCSDK